MTIDNIVSENRNHIIVDVKFDRNYFDSKIKTPSNFYKHLSNSKSTLPNGITNRMWWKRLKPNGFYKYKMNKDITEITFVMSTEQNFNELELKSRIKKIGNPLQLEVSFSISDYVNENLKNREGIEKFGWMNQPIQKQTLQKKYIYG
jgi:hypothetical protein